MKRATVFLFAALANLLTSTALTAATINITETLTGSQETPPTASPANGSGTDTLETTADLFAWTVNWSGLTSPFTAAHFHFGPPGVAGPVLIDLSAVGTLTLSSDMLSGSSVGSTTITAAQAAQIEAGDWYVNVHSDQFPDGEIRGQLLPTPESPSSSLVAAGILLLLGISARRFRLRGR